MESRPRAQVYPRVCGGTERVALDYVLATGLSPRVRGNPGHQRRVVGFLRSIPAYAGEPLSLSSAAISARVYPRVCGETTALTPPISSASGLSPRMRGNLHRILLAGLLAGSIPAYAGEPGA